jgi:nucleotide-binding universal stress UspA family protein
MYRSLLVPLDGSSLSEHALSFASAIARRSGAQLHLAYVHVPYTAEPIFVEGLPVIDQALHSLRREHERAYLERLSARLVAEAAIAATASVLEPLGTGTLAESIADTISRHAAAIDADLIVVSTHGRGGMTRFWLGSVADALIHMSPVPLLLIPPPDGAPDFRHFAPFHQILIPLDGTVLAEHILEHVLALGAVMPATYTLLRVVKPVTLFRAAPFTTPTDLDPDATMQHQMEAQRYLQAIATRLQPDMLDIRTQVMVAQQPAAAILEYARDNAADLIALATHGRGGAVRLLLGSVADKIVRGASTPVLLYRPSVEASGA